MARFRVASVTEVPVGELKRVEIDHTPICLAHADDGSFYAISDICSHEDYPLSEGWLEGLSIECQKHGSRFDLRTGEPHALPAVDPVPVYPVKVEDGDVYVEL